MLNQFFRPLIFLMRTDVYPRTVKRIADDLFALGDEFFNKMSGMEEGVFWDFCQSTLLNEVDSSIGIVVVFRLLDKSFDVSAIKVEDA